ncbi:hypothetical protein ACFYXJ_35830 [Streptomyces sp. NPDC002667]|uniref:hypothetical protein n=1 Tax=Streptomyces sp. NPDC002667 TaxID=3364657 RepID=UPI0036C37804
MSEDLEAVAVTAGVNALAGLMGSIPWSQIGGRIRGVLSRRGHEAEPALAQALESGDESGREQRLARVLAGLPSEDRAEILGALGAPTNIFSGDKSPTHTGSGDQHITYH